MVILHMESEYSSTQKMSFNVKQCVIMLISRVKTNGNTVQSLAVGKGPGEIRHS